jgi:hypothetical protein
LEAAQVTPDARRQLGKDIAAIVLAAERKFPEKGSGRLKMAYCIREARKRAPKEDNSSAALARTFGAMVLRIGIEIAVASIDQYKEEIGL